MSEEPNEKVYHEKQRLQFCAVHAINNLFQDSRVCSKDKLNQICYNLNSNRWNNPHKSIIGIGNYDVNVITAFLQTLEYDVMWFDKRKSPEQIKTDEVFGFLLNAVSKQKFFSASFTLNSNFKHWYVVRKLNKNLYFNLDSKLVKPVNIGNSHQMVEFLKRQLQEESCQLLLIIKTGKTKEDVYKNDTLLDKVDVTP